MAVGTLHIHIGAHKAGSSALQGFVQRNRAALAEAGVLVPRAGMIRGYGHHSNIVWETLRPDLFEPEAGALGDVAAELARADHPQALISSEEFELLRNRTEVDAFLAPLAAAAREVRVIIYVRPQFAYAASAYFQAVKAGNVSWFADFFNQAILWSRLNYDAYFRRWEGRSGVAVTVRPMNAAMRRAGIDLDLLTLLGLDGQRDRFETGARVNVGLGPVEVYALLYAKLRADYGGRPLDRAVCDRIRAFCTSLEGAPAGAYRALTRALAVRCERVHRDGNRAFFARHGLPAWETVFAEDIAAAAADPNVAVPAALRAQVEAIVDRELASGEPPAPA